MEIQIMKKVAIRRAGEAETLEIIETPDPEVTEYDVLVDVKATGMNWSEVMIRRGDWPVEFGKGFTLGAEGAGVVEKVGAKVTSVRPGDRVAVFDVDAYLSEEKGCYAEKVAVAEGKVLPIPENMDFPSAAALPMALLTAYDAMIYHSPMPDSGTAVITACSGAVGIVALQLAKRRGLRVIGTTRDESKKSLIASLGAEAVVASDALKLREKVSALCGSVDYIFDPINGETASELISLLNFNGTYVNYGFLSGTSFTVPSTLLFSQARVHGYVVLRNLADSGALQRVWRDVLPLAETNDVVVPVSKTFRFDQVVEAHRAFERGGHWGKLVLVQ